MTYVVRDAIKARNGKNTASIPALWEQDYLSMGYLPARKTPFEWRYPFRLKSEVKLNVPKTASLQQLAAQRAHGRCQIKNLVSRQQRRRFTRVDHW